MSSSTSRAGEQRGSGNREVVRATSAGSKPRTRATARLERSVHSPTVTTLGDHVRKLADAELRGVNPSGGSEPRGEIPSGGSGVRVAPNADVSAMSSSRHSGNKDVRGGSPPSRRAEPILVASERELPSPPLMLLPPAAVVFPRRSYLEAVKWLFKQSQVAKSASPVAVDPEVDGSDEEEEWQEEMEGKGPAPTTTDEVGGIGPAPAVAGKEKCESHWGSRNFG